MKRWSLIVLAMVVVLMLVALLFLMWDEIVGVTVNPPLLYEFPSGFRGLVTIRYGVPSCPPLGKRGEWIVLKISADGCLCTSSPVPYGWRRERYEYVGADGSRIKIPSGAFWEAESQIGPAVVSDSLQETFSVGNQVQGQTGLSQQNKKKCDEIVGGKGKSGKKMP